MLCVPLLGSFLIADCKNCTRKYQASDCISLEALQGGRAQTLGKE